MQLHFPELLMLLPSVCVNFWSKDMDLFAWDKCRLLGVCCRSIPITSPRRCLVCFVPLSCVWHACMNHACREGLSDICHGICIRTSISGLLGWCKMASRGDVTLSWLLLLLSGSLETNKLFLHRVIQRKKNLAWQVHAWEGVLLCSFSQSPHGRLLLAGSACSLLCCEIKLPKVEGKETNEVNEWISSSS